MPNFHFRLTPKGRYLNNPQCSWG